MAARDAAGPRAATADGRAAATAEPPADDHKIAPEFGRRQDGEQAAQAHRRRCAEWRGRAAEELEGHRVLWRGAQPERLRAVAVAAVRAADGHGDRPVIRRRVFSEARAGREGSHGARRKEAQGARAGRRPGRLVARLGAERRVDAAEGLVEAGPLAPPSARPADVAGHPDWWRRALRHAQGATLARQARGKPYCWYSRRRRRCGGHRRADATRRRASSRAGAAPQARTVGARRLARRGAGICRRGQAARVRVRLAGAGGRRRPRAREAGATAAAAAAIRPARPDAPDPASRTAARPRCGWWRAGFHRRWQRSGGRRAAHRVVVHAAAARGVAVADRQGGRLHGARGAAAAPLARAGDGRCAGRALGVADRAGG
mmetsp:Transcript_10844/g.28486  ORF Transcript_10844/g.28486 Transcript_10844/m.28486 type:complete len:374 (+) Transcript_10844:266-1387(+)